MFLILNVLGLGQDLQTTARGLNPARGTISSGRRRHFVNNKK